MAIYQYKGFNANGDEVKGHIESNTLEFARAKLKGQSIFLTEIGLDSSIRDKNLFPFLSKYLYRISRKEIGFFCKELGILLGAGISLDVALESISEQITNISLRKVVEQVRADIIGGNSLSEAFSKHESVFPEVYVQMIKVGEASGAYEMTLNRLAELEERNEALKERAVTALIYPGIMMCISVLVVFFLLVTVVPQIQTLFSSFDAELPLSTRIVLGASSFLQRFWSLSILVIILLFFGLKKYKETSKGRIFLDTKILNIPVLGTLMQKLELSRFSRNLGTLLETNVSLLDGLGIVTYTVENVIFREQLRILKKDLEEGSSIKESISKCSFFSNMSRGIIIAGEATDRLGEMFLKVAEISEDEIDSSVKRLTSTLEPLMLVVMGGITFFIMISIMLPIYQLTKHIK